MSDILYSSVRLAVEIIMAPTYTEVRLLLQATWHKLTRPSPLLLDTEERRRAQLLASMLVILLPSAFIVIVLQAMVVLQSVPVLVAGLLGIGLSGIAYLVSRTQYYAWGALLSVVTATISCSLVVVITRSATPLIFLTFGSLIGTLVLPMRSAIVGLAINVTAACGLSLLMPGWTLRDTSDEILFVLLMSIAIFGFVILRQQDLHQIRQQAATLVQAEKQMVNLKLEQEQTRIMQAFLQNVSHDFRTPLSVINTSTYLLKKAPNDEARLRYTTTIEEQASRIARLVDGMMMTMLDQKAEYKWEFMSLDTILHDLLNRYQDQAAEQGLQLLLERPPDLPAIMMDQEWIAQALRNTLENALHYTPAGGSVTIKVAVQGHIVVIDVIDTGIGIDSADLEYVFDRLYRTDKARNSHTGGVGLGLSIARKIIEAHGGQMSAHSRVGEGTTIRLELPFGKTLD
ncbi:MAG: hypothetical protein CL610_14720 [Anaerolineaceae bacterium]|nr:hypothetical protein [Anaerolineaceae bacterium]